MGYTPSYRENMALSFKNYPYKLMIGDAPSEPPFVSPYEFQYVCDQMGKITRFYLSDYETNGDLPNVAFDIGVQYEDERDAQDAYEHFQIIKQKTKDPFEVSFVGPEIANNWPTVVCWSNDDYEEKIRAEKEQHIKNVATAVANGLSKADFEYAVELLHNLDVYDEETQKKLGKAIIAHLILADDIFY